MPRICFLLWTGIFAAVLPVAAAEPAIRNLNVRGLQIGATTPLVIDGDELGASPRLLLPFPARLQLKAGATANRATFDVTLDNSVQPGYYQLRVVADGGVSLPMVIGVDRLPQRVSSDSIDQLPVALHGVINGSEVRTIKLAGKAGQKVMIEVEAQRIGSKLRPIVHLIGPKRLQVAWAWPSSTLFGDTRLEATLPDDGTYSIALHDLEYAPPGPSFFRLRVGQWLFVDHVFPPVITRGQSQPLEFLGPSSPLRVELPAPAEIGAQPLLWPNARLWSGPRPFVQVNSQAEFVERSGVSGMQELSVGRTASPSYNSLAVSGRLEKPNEEDRYRVAVKAGSKLRLEVLAERYGSPLDVALVVRNDRGDALARAEDGPSTLDPALEYTVPDQVTSMIVGVIDAQGRGGPQGIYRLTVEPQPAPREAKDFQLWTPTQGISLPAGGRWVMPIFAERRGYGGSVELAAAALPSGVRLHSASIPEGAAGTLVVVQRADAAPAAAITAWRGRSADGEERPVVIQAHPQERLQPWLTTEIAVATTVAKPPEFQVAFRGMPADAAFVPAAKLVLPVKVTRPADKSTVRLTLLTSQLPPLVNGQPDLNRTIRLEQPIEMAANQTDSTITILTPPELPASLYDMTIQADLLAAGTRSVLATAFAPVWRLQVRIPVGVKLSGPSRIEIVLDAKKETSLKIQGKIERRAGFKGDVTVTLAGLPAGTRADAVTVKAGATDFAVPVVVPTNVPAGELRGQLFATAVPDPQSNVRVRGRDVEVVLVLKPVKK